MRLPLFLKTNNKEQLVLYCKLLYELVSTLPRYFFSMMNDPAADSFIVVIAVNYLVETSFLVPGVYKYGENSVLISLRFYK